MTHSIRCVVVRYGVGQGAALRCKVMRGDAKRRNNYKLSKNLLTHSLTANGFGGR